VHQSARDILDAPEFHRLVSRRWRISLVLTACLFVLYYGYILLIATQKAFLSRRIGETTTIGIPIGAAVIVIAGAHGALRRPANRQRFRGRRLRAASNRTDANHCPTPTSTVIFFLIIARSRSPSHRPRRARSTREFCAAGRSVSAFQNDLLAVRQAPPFRSWFRCAAMTG
jgi:uncharacterized membrane protein (DUF485 family)